MKRLYITSLFRRPDERGEEGKLYLFDFDSGNVIKVKETRSLRGMCVHNGQYYVAGFRNDISLFDPDTLEFSDTVYYEGIDFLHKIYSHLGRIWIPSTGNDRIVMLEDGRLEVAFDITRSNRDTLHINSLAWDKGDNLYCVAHTLGQVLNLMSRNVLLGSGLKGPHDLEFLDDRRFIVNSSNTRESILGDASTRSKIQTILSVDVGPGTSDSMWGYTRGLAISEHLIFIGSAPVHIHVLDKELFCKGNVFQISNDPAESIFDILLDPRDWS